MFEIAGELYNTKAAIERHYRAIIGSRPAGTVIGPGSEDFPFLMAVLRHHDRRAEKIGVGVREFFVVDVPGAKGLWIRRVDGSETDLSLLKVIQRLGMTPRQVARYDIQRTLRAEVDDQIDDYRRRALRDSLRDPGEILGDTPPRVSGSDYRTLCAYHVDHHDPTFAALVEGFLIGSNLDYAEIPITHGECGRPCTITDPEIRHAWREYHREHATLRLLPAEQNLRRQTPKIDWQKVDDHVQRDSRRGHEAMDW